MQAKQDDSSAVTLVTKDGKEIMASKAKLSVASDFFSALFNNDMRENREGIVRLETISETVMRKVLEFLLYGSVEITHDNYEDLIEAADFLLIPALKTIVGKYLRRRISTSNCISTYYCAKRYQFDDLSFISERFILSNFSTVAESEEFLNLESQQVEQWISSDELVVSTEDEIFEIILKWTNQNKSERKEKFEELFRHVRLAFVSHNCLYGNVSTKDLVKDNPSSLKLVEDAMNGIYRSQALRKGFGMHIVVFTGKITLCYQPKKDKWYQLAKPPLHIRDRFLLSSFQGKMYVFSSAGSYSSVSLVYDPSSNQWAKLNSTFHDQDHTRSAVTVLGEDMYSVRERIRDCLPKTKPQKPISCLFKYNVKSNTWQELPASSLYLFSDDYLDYGICAVAMETYLYVIGGFSSSPRSYCRRLDITKGIWERRREMMMERCDAYGAAGHGKIFIAGGLCYAKSPVHHGVHYTYSDTCEVYNPETDEWQFVASLNTPRAGGSMVSLGGTLYVVGGVRAEGELALTVESYDYEENKWNETTIIPIDQAHPTSVKACMLNVSERVLVEIETKRTSIERSLLASLQ